MTATQPQRETYLIYDNENEDIRTKAETVISMLQVCNSQTDAISSLMISNIDSTVFDWDSIREGHSRFVFYVSIETEVFHRRVKKLIRPGTDNILVFLLFAEERSNFVDRLIKDIKKAAKKADKSIDPEKIVQLEDSIVKVSEIQKTATWWPKMLHFLYGDCKTRQTIGKRHTNKREIGVNFIFNHEHEKQNRWFVEQKRILEDQFNIKCIKMGTSEGEKYARHSECVVVYLHSNDLFKSRGCLSEEQRCALQYLERNKCKVTVFVNKISANCHTRLVNDTNNSLKLTGEGDLEYWMKLLRDLGIVKIQTRQDFAFYSTTIDDVYPVHFMPRRSVTAMTSRSGVMGHEVNDLDDILPIQIHGASLREGNSQMLRDVCYRYASQGQGDDDIDSDHVTGSNGVCGCLLGFLRRKNN